jgi:lipoprotein-releasing system permease protein
VADDYRRQTSELMYELQIGLRYLKSRRRQTFISLITVISIAGVAVGVMVLIIVLAIMSGFQQSLKDKILGINSHIWVLPQATRYIDHYQEKVERIRALPHVTLAAPFTTHEVMLSADGQAGGTFLRGVDLSQAALLADLKRYFPNQDLKALLTLESVATNDHGGRQAPRGIVLGESLALNLLAYTGQQLLVNSPLGVLSPAGIIPNVRTFTMSGTFTTGMREYDNTLALVALDQAQAFFDMGDTVTGIEVKVDNADRAREVAQAIQVAMGPNFATRDWMEMNSSLFEALKQEKVLMFIVLVLIILVAAFNIISTLVMMTMEKRADIAILKTMGARSSSIRKIFMFEGLLIGGLGTGVGALGGLIFTWNIEAIAKGVGWLLGIELFSPKVYFIDKLPADIRPIELASIVGIAVAVSFLATLYPAWKASRLDPVDALRYE